jgi:hypothetical protein
VGWPFGSSPQSDDLPGVSIDDPIAASPEELEMKVKLVWHRIAAFPEDIGHMVGVIGNPM